MISSILFPNVMALVKTLENTKNKIYTKTICKGISPQGKKSLFEKLKNNPKSQFWGHASSEVNLLIIIIIINNNIIILSLLI